MDRKVPAEKNLVAEQETKCAKKTTKSGKITTKIYKMLLHMLLNNFVYLLLQFLLSLLDVFSPSPVLTLLTRCLFSFSSITILTHFPFQSPFPF